MSKIQIGEVVNTFGLKGELKIFPYVDYFEDLKTIYLNNEPKEIERARYQKNVVIIKLKGLDDINDVESLKGLEVFVDEADMPELEEGEYYIKDLIGLDVYTDEGKHLGKVDDVFNTGANDIYQVGDILLPGTKEVLKEIDIENKKITVHIIKGLIWNLMY